LLLLVGSTVIFESGISSDSVVFEFIWIPLKREEAQVTKKPYVKEEGVVKKKVVTDKKEITNEVTSEELDTSNIDR
jgi:uncharacterized protein (TIGR02271 family)